MRADADHETGDGEHLAARNSWRRLRGRLRENQPRKVVALRVLLPVDEVVLGKHFQRIGEDWRAAVRGRTQPDYMRSERYPPVVPVESLMMKCNVNGHGFSGCRLLRLLLPPTRTLLIIAEERRHRVIGGLGGRGHIPRGRLNRRPFDRE